MAISWTQSRTTRTLLPPIADKVLVVGDQDESGVMQAVDMRSENRTWSWAFEVRKTVRASARHRRIRLPVVHLKRQPKNDARLLTSYSPAQAGYFLSVTRASQPIRRPAPTAHARLCMTVLCKSVLASFLAWTLRCARHFSAKTAVKLRRLLCWLYSRLRALSTPNARRLKRGKPDGRQGRAMLPRRTRHECISCSQSAPLRQQAMLIVCLAQIQWSKTHLHGVLFTIRVTTMRRRRWKMIQR